MKFIFKYSAFLCILSLTAYSCKKFVEIPGPKNQIITSQVFADSADASSALLGIYINSMNTNYGLNSGGMSIIPGLSADEIYQTGNNTEYTQFYADNVLPANNTNNGFWSSAYTYIFPADACISGIASSSGISVTAKSRLIGEARFIRAFEYFYLVNLYGTVPLVTTTNYITNANLPRAGTDQIYAEIIADLQFAEANLPPYSGTNTRPASPAASALLSKVYLYNNKYILAQAEATKVINSGSFSLEPDLNNVFLNTSAETIWQIAPVAQGRATFEGFTFVPSSATTVPQYPLTPALYNSFENGDNRRSQWIDTSVVNGAIYPYPYKYKQASAPGTVNEYEVVLRLADLYLVRAEAEINQGDLNDAVNDLNAIRSRAGLPNTTANDQPSVLQAIQHERRVEFFCEWANRWFDLKRWNLATAALSPLKSGWNTNKELYPVPLAQINTNPALSQNAGY
jgi:hypothetical protein